ncbi:MAG: response regulator [Methylococcales bacterium]|jgi:diguanylate cyclase (GGDEF)-like protein|nr:response regulator [Methylococcales bacterium]MBT7443346.1 response regulator [Methylococcales bacterium]
MEDQISILIVDDSKFNCAMIERTLQDGGYSAVRTARSAKDALKMMSEQVADVLIADWMMPEMDGLELTDEIRQFDEENNHYTYILLLTAKDGVEPLIEAFDRGVDDYLTKPPNKFELLSRIYAATRISGLQNSLLESTKALSRMNQALKGKMQTDPMTGFSNQKAIEKRITSLQKAAQTREGVLCLALLRVMDFDQKTAKTSRRVKDEITISLSRRLQRTVRPSDEIARVGDHEYLIVMYNPDRKNFQRFSLQRISNAINLRPISTSAGFIQIKAAIKVICTNDTRGSSANEMITLLHDKFDE